MAAEFSTLSLASDSNLRAYYKLENVSDTTANGYNLTNNGTVTFGAAVFNNGGDLGTSNSSKWLSIANNLGVSGNGDVCIAGWVKLKSEISSGQWILFQSLSNSGADRYLEINYEYNSGTRRISINASATGTITYNLTMGTSDFYHIAVNRSSANAVELFINGASVGTGSGGTSGGGNTNQFSIGRHATVSTGHASAICDDVVVFNRVLTSNEINSIYTGSEGIVVPDFSYSFFM